MDSAGPQPALRYRWTGREYDAETGFYFHRSRYYDPGVGRFVQEDRIGYAGGGNLYAYVNGDVLQARDPDGLTKDATWAYLSWDDLCMGVDLCFGGGGELRALTGGATYGQRQSNSMLAISNAMEVAFELLREVRKATVEIQFRDENGQVQRIQFTFRDIFALNVCPWCAGIPEGAAVYLGVAVDAASPVGGFAFGFGNFFDSHGRGDYRRIGVASGVDLSVGLEVGYARSFEGRSGSIQVGVGPGGYSVGGSPQVTFSATVGFSLFPLSGSASWTSTSKEYKYYWPR